MTSGGGGRPGPAWGQCAGSPKGLGIRLEALRARVGRAEMGVFNGLCKP